MLDLKTVKPVWVGLEGVLDLRRYAATAPADSPRKAVYVEAGRGCPFDCSFCATAPFWHRRYRVKAIADSNIGIMGHVGLTPQSATKLGGFKAQGRTADAAKQLFDDALALQDAGAFAVVLEAVPSAVAARVSEALHVPTVGIGVSVS